MVATVPIDRKCEAGWRSVLLRMLQADPSAAPRGVLEATGSSLMAGRA